jgi:NTE family protein
MFHDDDVALALQGGGVHGAFAWGVLDRLTEQGLRVRQVSGVSSGALVGTMYVQGMVKDGPEGARREMKKLWDRFSQAALLNPVQSDPLSRWLFGADLSHNLAWHGLETAMRLFSPAQLNPFGHNPLRPIIADCLDRRALSDPRALKLTVSATDVQTGDARHWTNANITVDVLLASCCLPFVFHAAEVDGRAYWDGGFSGNPPLGPLLKPIPPRRIVLVRAQPVLRPGAPVTPVEIFNRLNEIACHGVLATELAALPKWVKVITYGEDGTLAALPVSSKFNADDVFIADLFQAGRKAAAVPTRAE